MLFRFSEVTYAVAGRRILDNIAASIPDQGITVLQGASGSGKSTLLRLLNRLEVPTSGEIQYRGERLDDLDPLELRRRVGMVFQQPTPFPGSVRENLQVADSQTSDLGMVEALDTAGLDESFLSRTADELSGGEAQRMCLARTLLTQPEVLLMDEPTSALDPESTEHLEQAARRLVDDGMPMVWVTHDVSQADRLADSRLLLVEGKLRSEDDRG